MGTVGFRVPGRSRDPSSRGGRPPGRVAATFPGRRCARHHAPCARPRRVGFRVPAYQPTLEVIRRCGVLIGPSANISGQASGQFFDEIRTQFDKDLVGIKDDAALTGQDSTILDLSDSTARILRQGAITKEELLQSIPELKF